ncbi:MAG: 16S rRNA (adenine(1518)-N(6)/adenine(1519)-N(6))-dimethyltransferase RsmA [Campylobacterota bacterium]|nr:16S rRNA (adenine(1518)-N(6)/adenine(1519)-N(6))-dimethyltransferase RsmA [Campylobacterota bacterium]
MQKEHVAKKKFGQNFLKDESVLYKIVEAMPKNDHKIAEIGPGLGDLTKFLVDVKSVTTFEVDTDLCKLLNDTFKDEITTNRLTLHCGDVLDTWKTSLLDEPYDLVANLPYYIATNIILKALADPLCHTILVMVQREVALKFAAKAGEKNFGSLGIITQSVGEASIVVDVPPEAFDPMPKVDSAVLLISKTASRSDEAFEAMLKLAFTQPRKTLLKNLSSHYEKEKVLAALQALELSTTIRPHQVTTSDYHQLYKIL